MLTNLSMLKSKLKLTVFASILLFLPFQNCSKLHTQVNSIESGSSGYNRYFITNVGTRNASTTASVGLVEAEVHVDAADSVGVQLTGSYLNSACTNKAVKIDMYLLDINGNPEFQNQCFTNAADLVSSFPKRAFCYFRSPVPAGTNAARVLLRTWKATENCTSYADEVGRVSDGYVEQFMSGSIENSAYYQAFAKNELVTISKINYMLKMDRRGGATYEFYNKRATVGARAFVANALHAHSGAALQIAFHHHVAGLKMIPDSCDASQGYWNPTQAGFFCAYKNGVVDFHVTGPNSPIICDGAFNNNCGAAVKSVEFQEHQMFNWDYGPSYQGPYNARDTAYFSQAVEASDNFVEYSLTFQNKGITRAGPIEIPTFYFNNNFRHYFFKTSNSSQIKEVSIPLRLTAVDSFRVPDNNVSLDWISFENTSGVANDVYTLAWFYSNEFTQDVMQSGYSVSESQFYKSIKFTNEPIFNAVQNKKYNLKYVVFPFKYSEVIDSRFGRMSVADVIVKLKYEYLNSTTAPTAPPTPTMPVEPRFLKFSSAEAAQSLWPVSALIDGDKRSSYSSPLMPTAQNNAQQKIAAYLPVQSTVNKLKITARMYNGMALGFPKSYNLYVTSPENTSWINLGTFSNQPDTSGTVTLTFAPLKTHGVHIVPLELGKDNEGNYYFQLSELEIYGD